MNKTSFYKWMRVIHRDLGFLMVGVCIIYGISGFLLNHMNGKDPAFKTIEEAVNLGRNLSGKELSVVMTEKNLPEVKKVMKIDDENYRVMLNGGIGVYNSSTGIIDYELHKKNQFIYLINKLHYNKVNGWNIMGDFFAFSLIFFAISGIIMVKGKRGIKGSGKWYLITGIIIPVIYMFLV